MAPLVCPHCGTENPDGAEVCQHCGESLASASQPPRLLSQIQGLIPAEPVITTGERRARQAIPLHRLPQTPPGPRSTARRKVAAARSPKATSGPEQKPSSHQDRTLWIVAGMMFLAVLVGSLWHMPGSLSAPVRPSVKNAYAFIDILPPGAKVLVAWDYDPATQGEMQLLAQAILHHLQRKGTYVVFMSLRPFGPNVAADAQALTQRLAPGIALAAPPPSQLGYLPGDSIALRSLALSPVNASSQPKISALTTGMHPAQDVDAFDLIIQITSDMTSSREWVEQVAARSNTPLLVAASGAVAPLLRPYEQTHQIRVLLAGYPDALAYEFLLGEEGPAVKQAASQTLLTALFLGIILIAALRSLFRTDHR